MFWLSLSFLLRPSPKYSLHNLHSQKVTITKTSTLSGSLPSHGIPITPPISFKDLNFSPRFKISSLASYYYFLWFSNDANLFTTGSPKSQVKWPDAFVYMLLTVLLFFSLDRELSRSFIKPSFSRVIPVDAWPFRSPVPSTAAFVLHDKKVEDREHPQSIPSWWKGRHGNKYYLQKKLNCILIRVISLRWLMVHSSWCTHFTLKRSVALHRGLFLCLLALKDFLHKAVHSLSKNALFTGHPIAWNDLEMTHKAVIVAKLIQCQFTFKCLASPNPLW